MKALFLSLSLLSSAALAGGVDTMVAQCEEVMRCGACQVTNLPLRPGQKKVISWMGEDGQAHSEEVDAGRYGWFQEPGYAKDAAGHFVMCNRVREAMRDPTSLEARLPRLMFKQTWDGRTYCPVGRR